MDRLRSFRFLYENHTISSITRENVAFKFQLSSIKKRLFHFHCFKFSLRKILVFPGNLYLEKSLEANFFLFSKTFLQCVLFVEQIIVFLDIFLSDCSIPWQASISFAVTQTSISDRMTVTVSSRSSSVMLSVIPDKISLFL